MSIAKKHGLAEIFQDGMLFQRDKGIVLWGYAAPDTHVTVSLYREKDAHAEEKAVLSGCSTADAEQALSPYSIAKTEPLLSGCSVADENGNFRIILPPREAGENYLLCVDFDSAPEESVRLSRIGFGDIWLAGGQSNMEFFLKYDRDWEETKKLPPNPRIRMYNVPQRAFAGHTTHNKTGYGYWFDDRDPALETFSAPAYRFAREVQAATGIPIGIIGCNWGGSSASTWVDKEVLSAPPLDRYLKEYEEAVAGIPAKKLAADSLAGWEFEDSAGHAADFEPLLYGRDRDWQLNYMKIHAGEPAVPMGPYHFNRPSGLYRTMLSELIPFSIKGVLWYQGESDAGDYALLYDKLLTGLIESWRLAWDDDFPFLIVQLAPFGQWLDCDSRGYTTVREKQAYVSQNIPGVHMAAIMDLGSYYDIHPKEKMEVGRRLALLARGHVYGETELLCDPPEAVSAVRVGDRQIAVNFRHADGLFSDGKGSDWRIGLRMPTALAKEASSSEDGRTVRNAHLQKQHIESAENIIEDEPSTQSMGSQERHTVPAENTIEGKPSAQSTGSQDQEIVPAEVTLKDDGVLLTLPDSIPDELSPAWVALGWDDYAEIHIFNRSGLSAAPFKLEVKAPTDCSSLS